MRLRLGPSLSNARRFDRSICCRHVLLNVNRRDAQRFRLIAEPIAKIILGQQIAQRRVDVEQIANRVLVLKPIKTTHPHATGLAVTNLRVLMKRSLQRRERRADLRFRRT